MTKVTPSEITCVQASPYRPTTAFMRKSMGIWMSPVRQEERIRDCGPLPTAWNKKLSGTDLREQREKTIYTEMTGWIDIY